MAAPQREDRFLERATHPPPPPRAPFSAAQEGGSGKGRRRNADCGANATELHQQPRSGVGEGGRAGGVEDAGLKAKCLSPSHVRAALQSSLHNAVQRASEKGMMFARGIKQAQGTRREKAAQCSDWWLPVHFGAALPEGAQRGVRRPGQDSSRLDKTTWLHAKKTCFLCFLAFPCFTRYNSI